MDSVKQSHFHFKSANTWLALSEDYTATHSYYTCKGMFAARKKEFCVKEHVFKLGCCSPETPRRNVSTVLMCLLMGKNVYTDCVCVCRYHAICFSQQLPEYSITSPTCE